MSSTYRKNLAAAICIAVALLSGCAHLDRHKDSEIDRLARIFLQTLSPRDMDAFREAGKDDLPMFHFGAGSRVRQMFFGPDQEGRNSLCPRSGHCDIDAESMHIVERTWEIIHDAS